MIFYKHKHIETHTSTRTIPVAVPGDWGSFRFTVVCEHPYGVSRIIALQLRIGNYPISTQTKNCFQPYFSWAFTIPYILHFPLIYILYGEEPSVQFSFYVYLHFRQEHSIPFRSIHIPVCIYTICIVNFVIHFSTNILYLCISSKSH